ncbi:hypothetical protein ACPPVO_22425 [Dactylosporangium sp. McL0621]|uniref:hypothetical protein n=1 Tax=Dactylosporangium sp. McL0621 TaxID=3415678 RepID=UPI003CED346A
MSAETAERDPRRPKSDTGHLVNWKLIGVLAVKPHKHLNIVEGARYGLMTADGFDTGNNGVGEVMQEARTFQHLCDLAGIPEGWNYSAHIDARVFLLLAEVLKHRARADRIVAWHSRETGPGGMVGDYCTECGHVWPCDTRRMAEGTYADEEETL